MLDQTGTELKPGDSVAISFLHALATGVVLSIDGKSLTVAIPFIGFDPSLPIQGIVKTYAQAANNKKGS